MFLKKVNLFFNRNKTIMGWTWGDNVKKPVVKLNGECINRSQWKYCPYWTAKHRVDSKRVTGFRCLLFDVDKNNGMLSLPQCNARYGTTYDGDP